MCFKVENDLLPHGNCLKFLTKTKIRYTQFEYNSDTIPSVMVEDYLYARKYGHISFPLMDSP